MASFRQAGARDNGHALSGRVRAPSCIADTEGARGHHPPVMERLSNAQLDALIAELQSGLDPAAADEDAQIIQ